MIRTRLSRALQVFGKLTKTSKVKALGRLAISSIRGQRSPNRRRYLLTVEKSTFELGTQGVVMGKPQLGDPETAEAPVECAEVVMQ